MDATGQEHNQINGTQFTTNSWSSLKLLIASRSLVHLRVVSICLAVLMPAIVKLWAPWAHQTRSKEQPSLIYHTYGLDFLWQIRNHFGVFLHRPFKRQKFWRIKESRHSKSRTVRKSAFKFSMEVWWTHRCNTCRAAVHGAAMRHEHKKGGDIKVCYVTNKKCQ